MVRIRELEALRDSCQGAMLAAADQVEVARVRLRELKAEVAELSERNTNQLLMVAIAHEARDAAQAENEHLRETLRLVASSPGVRNSYARGLLRQRHPDLLNKGTIG